ncbi:unnamed protein product [Aspergillus oryzae]|uniref:Unnamed protein product n=2 Tax=Aspergillus oryzae TaxID=5062 RepID=A0AAN4YK81_ASPOZ|nr:unnamed protein product [Aspergillus oryzae]GMF94124.1 unnamed protein product [Aspergillus oryzae]GMG10194.1 unnamed protein product [Aspergillus oryzae]GMG30630.1 unnamed protein product [Aspergillus oryzae]GMG51977.1 unnamed protein product [Aspergillus oryzae var. brunneus]
MSLSKTETDVILNKANVALARSQRLVASWLPPKTQEEQANTKSEEALQQEEDEPSNMKSLSGASSATNQSQTTAGRAGDDDDEDEGRTASVGKKGPTKKRKAESIPRSLDYIVTDNDDRGDRVDGGGDGEVETLVKQGESLSQQPSRLRGRRKATSFLDEILAERSRKRKKK